MRGIALVPVFLASSLLAGGATAQSLGSQGGLNAGLSLPGGDDGLSDWDTTPQEVEDLLRHRFALPDLTEAPSSTYVSDAFRAIVAQEAELGQDRDQRAIDGTDAAQLVGFIRDPVAREALGTRVVSQQAGQCSTSAANFGAIQDRLDVFKPRRIGTARAFVADCLKPVYGAATADPAMLDVRARGAVLVLTTSSTQTFCSAFLVAPNKVATARHCLFRDLNKYRNPYRVDQVSVVPLGPSMTTVTRIAVLPKSAYATGPDSSAEFSAPASATDLAQDYVELDLATPAAGIPSLPAAGASAPEAGAQLFMVGFNVISWIAQTGIATVTAPAALDLAMLRNAYVMDDAAICAAIVVSPGCIVHGCQSVAQTSGAALLRRGAGGANELLGTLWGGKDRYWPNAADGTAACMAGAAVAAPPGGIEVDFNLSARRN